MRDGNDVIYNLLLDFPTAVLGGQLEIPTIDGSKVKIKIEPGTQPWQDFAPAWKGFACCSRLWQWYWRLGCKHQCVCA